MLSDSKGLWGPCQWAWGGGALLSLMALTHSTPQSRGAGKGETNTRSLPVPPTEPGFTPLTSAGRSPHLLSVAKLGWGEPSSPLDRWELVSERTPSWGLQQGR